MKKVFREGLNIIEEEGFTVCGAKVNRNGHLVVDVVCEHGRAQFKMHNTPAPNTAHHNIRTRIRWLRKRLEDPTFAKR